jgi:hypothetical protein
MAKSKPQLIVAIPDSTVCTDTKIVAFPTPISMAIDCPFEMQALQRVFGEYYDPHNPRDPSVEPLSPRVHSPTPVYSPHYQPTHEATFESSNKQAEDMAEQVRRAEAVAAALDREIARLKTQLEALEK